MKGKRFIVLAFLLAFSITLVSAQDYAIDIKIGDGSGENVYAFGDSVNYNVILKQDSSDFSGTVKVTISDVSGKKVIGPVEVESNKQQLFLIEKDFPSGYWSIQAEYEGKSVKRLFSVSEREDADFSLENDKLIIRNNGNVPYTKTIQILIGEKQITQKQYIDVGKYKEIRLVAPDGNYNIQVAADGVTKLTRQNVYLTGTGQVIGALDQQLADSQPILGSARDVKGDSIFSSKNFSVAFIFIAAVFGLFILLMIEKVMRQKRSGMAKDMVNLH